VAEAQACLEQQRFQTDREIEDVFWRSVECKSRLQVQAYLEVYPTGRYVTEAWACLEGQLGLNRAARVLVQQGLAAVGHGPGPTDGLFGGAQTRTRRAIRAWQAAKEMDETGYLTREQADTLMALGQEAEEARRVAEAQVERAARAEAAWQAREADDAAYTQAQRIDTAAAYADYLRAYPTGQHGQEALALQATGDHGIVGIVVVVHCAAAPGLARRGPFVRPAAAVTPLTIGATTTSDSGSPGVWIKS